MKRGLKWVIILAVAMILASVAVVLIVPGLVDVRRFKPRIERMISQATGCPFELGGDMRLSIFPWTAIAVSDVRLGNPSGFSGDDMVRVSSFEVEVKFLPLVMSRFRDIQVRRFILKGPQVVLERNTRGMANWEMIGKRSPAGAGRAAEPQGETGVFPVNAVSADELIVEDGALTWTDQTTGSRVQVSDIRLELRDVSLAHPVPVVFSASVDGKPFGFTGSVGPLGTNPGRGEIPLDISMHAFGQLKIDLKGTVTDPLSRPRYRLSVDIPSFSPRKLMKAAGLDLPVTPADPGVLNRVTLHANLKGSPDYLSVPDGRFGMDETHVKFSCRAEEFSGPNVTFDMDVDRMDVDRYLPPDNRGDTGRESAGAGSPVHQGIKTDYSPLRRLVLDGALRVGKLRVSDVWMQDVDCRVTGKNGLFRVEPLNLKLSDGKLTARGSLNVKKDVPRGDVRFEAEGIRVQPLLSALLKKDFLEGKLNADLRFSFVGDDIKGIEKSLKGGGSVRITDGAVKGIDLTAMVRNTDGAYGFSGGKGARRRTEFSRFESPFDMKNGIIYTDNTTMLSPLFRFHTHGRINLLTRTVDLRIESTFVTTRKKDTEKMKRSEVTVPVLVTGSLSSPQFRPDLRGLAQEKLEEKVFKSKKFRRIFEKEEMKSVEKNVKSLLEGFFGGAGSEERSQTGNHGAD